MCDIEGDLFSEEARGVVLNNKGTGGKHGAWDQDKERRKGRGNFTLDHRNHFDGFCLFH